MLVLTDTAVEAVKGIVSSAGGAPETAGLRVTTEPAAMGTTLQLSVVSLPNEDDEVIQEEGARVFLEPEAAMLLDDKILDAEIDNDQVEFTIADQLEA